MVQQARRAGAVPDSGQVDDDRDVLVALAGVTPDVLIDPEHPDPVEAGGVGDQDPPALGQDGVVGGVPRDPEGFGDTGDREVLADDRLQRPAQRTAGQLGPRLGGPAGVLAPDVPATGAPVPADRDQQRGGAPAEGFVREAAGHAVARDALAATPPAPPIGLGDPTGQHRTIRLEVLPDDLQAEIVQAAERGQVRAGECNVRQRRGPSGRQRENSHPRRTPTLTRSATRRPDYTLIRRAAIR